MESIKWLVWGLIKLTRNATKTKFTYNGYGIAFDGSNSWNFGDEFAQNVLIFGVENALSKNLKMLTITYQHQSIM